MNGYLRKWSRRNTSESVKQTDGNDYEKDVQSYEIHSPEPRVLSDIHNKQVSIKPSFPRKEISQLPLFLSLATKAVDSDTKLRNGWVDKVHCQGLVCAVVVLKLMFPWDTVEVISSLWSWTPLFPQKAGPGTSVYGKTILTRYIKS